MSPSPPPNITRWERRIGRVMLGGGAGRGSRRPPAPRSRILAYPRTRVKSKCTETAKMPFSARFRGAAQSHGSPGSCARATGRGHVSGECFHAHHAKIRASPRLDACRGRRQRLVASRSMRRSWPAVSRRRWKCCVVCDGMGPGAHKQLKKVGVESSIKREDAKTGLVTVPAQSAAGWESMH